jgi:hypothetical protein
MSLTILNNNSDKNSNDKNSNDNKETYFITLSAPGTLIGATVSAIVYTTLSTSGEIAAAVTGTGIELTGNLIAYGTELAVGSIPANTIRMAAKTYGAIARPTISNSSRIGALGISVLAGTGAAFTTSALIYGGKQVSYYLYSCIEDYKQKIAQKIQYQIQPEMELFIKDIDEDELQIIEEKEGLKHSHQDDSSYSQ